MPAVSFGGLLVVAAIAVCAPLLVGLVRWIRVPAVVLEILAGIAVGPSGLGWVEIDLPIQILALIGLAFLLFLAGLEIDVGRRGAAAAGLLQATSLPFLVTVTQIGVALDEIRPDTAAALVTAGLLSVVIFPLTALTLLGGRTAEENAVTPAPAQGPHP